MKNTLLIKEFTALIEINRGIIFKVSRAYCSKEVCREDLFQDILLNLWKGFSKYDKQRKFSTWMYRIALNTAISQFRKDKGNKVDVVEELPVYISGDTDTDKRNEREVILHKAINQLSKIEKSIIILYMDDYPYEEISEIICISVSNVGVKISRIKSKLQTILKELNYGL